MDSRPPVASPYGNWWSCTAGGVLQIVFRFDELYLVLDTTADSVAGRGSFNAPS